MTQLYWQHYLQISVFFLTITQFLYSNLKKTSMLHQQQQNLKQFISSFELVTLASYKAAWILARKTKKQSVYRCRIDEINHLFNCGNFARKLWTKDQKTTSCRRLEICNWVTRRLLVDCKICRRILNPNCAQSWIPTACSFEYLYVVFAGFGRVV